MKGKPSQACNQIGVKPLSQIKSKPKFLPEFAIIVGLRLIRDALAI